MEFFHYDTFIMKNIKEDTLLITAPLTFYTDSYSGKIVSFSVKLDPEGEPILFKRRS